jgi:hypothetical protein
VVKAVFSKIFATAASVLCAGLTGAWYAIKVKQSADLGVPAWSQAFTIITAAVLFAPFLALIFLCIRPRTIFRQDPWWGSLFFGGLALLWLFLGLFLSIFVGFGGF